MNRWTFGVVTVAVENKGVKFGTESWGSNMKSVALCSGLGMQPGPWKTVGQ